MQATARRLSVVSATSRARRRLIRDVRPEHRSNNRPGTFEGRSFTELQRQLLGHLAFDHPRRSHPRRLPRHESFERPLFVFHFSEHQHRIATFDTTPTCHCPHQITPETSNLNRRSMTNKTDAGNGSEAVCRVFKVHPSPSPDPRRSALAP